MAAILDVFAIGCLQWLLTIYVAWQLLSIVFLTLIYCIFFPRVQSFSLMKQMSQIQLLSYLITILGGLLVLIVFH